MRKHHFWVDSILRSIRFFLRESKVFLEKVHILTKKGFSHWILNLACDPTLLPKLLAPEGAPFAGRRPNAWLMFPFPFFFFLCCLMAVSFLLEILRGPMKWLDLLVDYD